MSGRSLLPTSLWAPLSRSARYGWIGIDVGTRLIKLAQLVCEEERWRLAGRWTIGAEDDAELSPETLRASGLGVRGPQIKEARNMFRGRLAAATLPSACMGLRSLELPTGPRNELLSMVEQELAGDEASGAAEIDFDAWETETTNGISKVVAVSNERALGMTLARELLAAGVQCGVLDSAPCAMARAVRLCDPAVANEPVAALDFGDSSVMLTVAHEDRPVFCRVLRNCGLQTLIQRVQEKLDLRRSECRQLLTRHGLPGNEKTETAETIYRIVAPPLAQLIEELRRSFQFLSHQSPRWFPKRLWLLGGGATITNLSEYLATRIGIPTAPWNLSPNSLESRDSIEPLYGVAAGLSLLAWEANPCM
jgi:Tfp pilus assembly PilM family ATPase